VPTLRRIVAFGNCDAASALMLARGGGVDALVLANPWTFDPDPEAVENGQAPPAPMPPAALRRHYLRRLTDPAALKRLFTGKVRVKQMTASLAEAAKPSAGPTALAASLRDGLAGFGGPVTILLAENDRTAQAFLANWDGADARVRRCPGASHSFVEPQARTWLQGQVLAALRSFG
jgi:pimeloyl-ACP methyl ester carboxylesterase